MFRLSFMRIGPKLFGVACRDIIQTDTYAHTQTFTAIYRHIARQTNKHK